MDHSQWACSLETFEDRKFDMHSNGTRSNYRVRESHCNFLHHPPILCVYSMQAVARRLEFVFENNQNKNKILMHRFRC